VFWHRELKVEFPSDKIARTIGAEQALASKRRLRRAEKILMKEPGGAIDPSTATAGRVNCITVPTAEAYRIPRDLSQ
jgi:hypothetical protein